MTAPLLSVTTPTMLPVNSCAASARGEDNPSSRLHTISLFIAVSLSVTPTKHDDDPPIDQRQRSSARLQPGMNRLSRLYHRKLASQAAYGPRTILYPSCEIKRPG